jgi:hypothetical protein
MKRFLFVAVLVALFVGVGLILSYGQDAPPTPGPSSPVKTAKTWKDPETGLTWQVTPTGGGMKWTEAKAHCKNLSLDGHRGWRLPTISELRSLIRGCLVTQRGGPFGVRDTCLSSGCAKGPYHNCLPKSSPGLSGAYWPPDILGDADFYWSASLVSDNDFANTAWGVNFDDARVLASKVDVSGNMTDEEARAWNEVAKKAKGFDPNRHKARARCVR